MSKTIVIILGVIVIVAIGGLLLSRGNNTNSNNSTLPSVTATTVINEPNDQTMTSTSNTSESGQMKEFTITGSNFKFEPTTLAVNQGDTVKIIFKNSGGIHDFVIDEFNVRTQQINGGAEETVQFVADKAGTFEFYCSVGTHRQMGMKGTLTVQ